MTVQTIDARANPRGELAIKQAFEQPQWYLGGTAYNIKIRAETVQTFLGGKRFGNILDIGCGNGALSLPFLNPDNRLTLLDQSQSMLQIARSRVPAVLSSQVQTLHADFMQAKLGEQNFDLIISVGVLAYIERRDEFIRKIKALLKPGGSVIIECTDVSHFVSRLVLAYHWLCHSLKPGQMRTVVGSSAKTLAILQELGFERCGAYRYSLPLPLLRKLMTQELSYKAIRFLFGPPSHNRNAWLGNECIYHFKSTR